MLEYRRREVFLLNINFELGHRRNKSNKIKLNLNLEKTLTRSRIIQF
jgi:hypothetical protein